METFSLKEIISVTMILFAIIDILGAIPVIIEMRQRVGHIQSEKASAAVLVLMIGFLLEFDSTILKKCVCVAESGFFGVFSGKV